MTTAVFCGCLRKSTTSMSSLSLGFVDAGHVVERHTLLFCAVVDLPP
jgi:hypothetical protein